MRRISDTLARLERLGSLSPGPARTDHDLTALTGFGSNPGGLRAWVKMPSTPVPGAALVVALHGCTQSAADYAVGTGWSTLAERSGFVLLCPEQRRTNNFNRCFNWFDPADTRRVGGEAESVAQMVTALVRDHDIDPARVFVTGLSAGGAMAAVMLATYPDLFAGGAVIGGLPVGSAAGVAQAFDRMRGHGHAGTDAAVAAVRGAAAGADQGRWPTLSIWHGDADKVVAQSNMAALGRQWRALHGLAADAPATVEQGANWERDAWHDATGRTVVEEWNVAGMAHGVPIDPAGVDGLGTAGPYMLDVGLASTARIAAGWGLDAPAVETAPVGAPAPPPTRPDPAPPRSAGVQDIIERALRSAGLMR